MSVRQAGRRTGDGERGNVALLEAAFLAAILLSSVMLLAGEQYAPAAVTPARPALEQQVKDALLGLETIQTNDWYERALDRAIAQAYLGNTTPLDTYLRRGLPDGAGYRLWLDNGHARSLLAGPEDSGIRQSVSASRVWHPRWSYANIVPSFDTVTPDMALPMQGYAVAQGALVKEGGIPVQVRIVTDNGTYDGAFITGVRDGPAADVYLLNETSQPSYAWLDPGDLPMTTRRLLTESANGPLPGKAYFVVAHGTNTLTVEAVAGGLTAAYTLEFYAPGSQVPDYTISVTNASAPVTVSGPAEGNWTVKYVPTPGVTVDYAGLTVDAFQPMYNADWSIVVEERAGKPLPAGTNITVTFPYPFLGGDTTLTTQDGWRNIQATPAPDTGWVVTAELATPLQGDKRTLVVHGDRSAAVDALYVVRADLGNGTSSSAALAIPGVVTVTTRATDPIEHRFYVSGPKPMAPGVKSRWGVTFVNPVVASSPALDEKVLSMDLWTPGGEKVFGDFDPLFPSSNRQEWDANDTNIHWEDNLLPFGDSVAPANGFSAAQFKVAALPVSSSSEPPLHMPVWFDNGYHAPLRDQIRPYVAEGAFPPSSSTGTLAGMPVFDPGLQDSTVEWYVRSSRAAGSFPYNVSLFAPLSTYADSLRVGLMQSHLNISKSQVHIGEQADVQVDFSGLFSHLRDQMGGVSFWEVDASVYDPSQAHGYADARSPSSQWTTNENQMKVGFVPKPGSFFGPHALLAEARFAVVDSDTGDSIIETTRLLGVIDVVPDGGQAESALYWVILEAWMPDWT
jgi:hypothetical protein